MEPITPKELEEKPIVFPDYVVAAFNKLITDKYNIERNKSHAKISFTIHQKDAVEEILKQSKIALVEITKDDIFKKHYLDVEKFYEQSGWKMVFDKPGWDENYEAYWTVSVK